MKLILTFFFFLNTLFAVACSCVGNSSVRQAKKSADFVASGVILNSKEVQIDNDEGFDISFMDFTFKITQKYKGKVNVDTVTIRTGFGGGDCGVEFELGREYLIYGRDENLVKWINWNYKAKNINVYRTDICTRTKLLVNASEELKKL